MIVCCVVGGFSQSPTATDSLMVAFEERNLAAVLKALENGADATAKDVDGNTTIMYAVIAFRGQDVKTAVTNLVARGADVTAKNNNEFTALHMAALLEGGEESVLVLVNMGANVNAIDYDGNTPLHWAASSNTKTETARTLIACGADKRAKNENKLEPKDLLTRNKKISWENKLRMETLLN